MHINRDLDNELKEALQRYPVVVLTGARQTGKTTLTRLLPGYHYINLEQPDLREMAQTDPHLLLARSGPLGTIIDEFQRVPQLVSYIQVLVDATGRKGQYVLTGSNNFLLMEQVGQSLAGRAAILRLLPLSLGELAAALPLPGTDALLHQGMYPAIHAQGLPPTKSYAYYYQTYLERDLRQLTQLKNLSLFQRFVRLCAGRVGQLFNAAQLANEVGVSARTISEWVSVLEASHVVFFLSPYYENMGKRLTKTPKLYFHDTGLACYLLGIEQAEHVATHPLRGALFENLVVLEYLKQRFNQGLEHRAFFYRDSHQNEVDMVICHGREYWLVEIKSAATYHKSFSTQLFRLAPLLAAEKVHRVVVYDGQEQWHNDELLVLPYTQFVAALWG